jgi:hypothetical protein
VYDRFLVTANVWENDEAIQILLISLNWNSNRPARDVAAKKIFNGKREVL